MNTVDLMYEKIAGDITDEVNKGANRQKLAKWLRNRIVYLAAIEEAERMYQTGEAQNYAPVAELHRN